MVNEQNIAEYRAVQLGSIRGRLRIIDSGLSENDVIIVKGIQRVFPGTPVNPTKASMRSINDAANSPSAE